MKKTSTRTTAIAGFVVLGALAIVLAQHDARKREREQPMPEPFAAQPATPIPVDDPAGDWGSGLTAATKSLVVRGNNNQFGSDDSVQNKNPLRTEVNSASNRSEVVQAAAGFPSESSTSGFHATPSPPSWLGGNAGGGAANAASASSEPGALPPAIPSALPSLPALPIADSQATNSAAFPLPFLARPEASATQSISNDVGDMSDTQRGAMQPTNLLSAQEPPTSPFAQQAPNAQQPFPAARVLGNSLPQAALPNGELGQSHSQFVAPTSGIPDSYPTIPTAAARAQSQSGNAVGLPPAGFNNPSYGPRQGFPPGQAATTASSSVLQTNPAPVNSQPSIPAASGNATFRTPAALAGLVSSQPGNRYLDGSQNPNMLIQKRAPEEIQVGKKATFVITVRNVGNATAHDVSVVDSVPQGVRFIESAPPASPTSQGILSWNLGEMAAGDERTISLHIVPEVQGEVGSNALVYFAAQASVRTVATLPQLELQLSSQPDMLIGSRQQVSVVVKNSGTGVAQAVRLEADLPEQLKHDSGESQLAAGLGDMRPNELRSITLDLTAVQPGKSQIVMRTISDDGASAEEIISVDVLAPQLTATIEGPKLRYLERQATYQIKVQNIGTAAASNLDFVVHLPAGLKYNSANNRGSYDPALHTVSWGLYELPAGETAPIELTVLPVELGPQAITFAATADLGLRAEAKGQVLVDGLAELTFTVGQDNQTIEVGASSTYSVQITNVGNKADKDVRLAVLLPSGSKLIAVDAQVNYRIEGSQILFEPVAEMRSKDQYTYRFQVEHHKAGTQIVRAQLTSSNWPVAVIKESGTLVYNDQN